MLQNPGVARVLTTQRFIPDFDVCLAGLHQADSILLDL